MQMTVHAFGQAGPLIGLGGVMLLALGLSPLAALAGASALAPKPLSSLKIEGVKTHPTVFVTREDIENARANAKKHAWAKAAADEVTSAADAWMKRSDEWILKTVPGKGACFSYGFTGCPICGGSLGIWNAAKASFDDPGHVLCSNGHRLPDEAHPDAGTGYHAKDGRIHYFVGSYNAWAVEALTFEAAESLAYAYSLTGDERYAEKASLILDALADAYPSCNVGSWDYPEKHNTGRFNRPQYQVARVLVHYVDIYDQLYSSPAMDRPSVRAGMNRRKNIEENMLKNGGQYCYEQSFKGGMTNGVADYERGAMAVGIALGIPEYVRWAVDGPYGIQAMLDNNLGRDGSYYETASGYAYHARGLYISFAEPLLNYRGSLYPNGLNLYEHPKFARFMCLHNLRLNCTGTIPSYGDASPITKPFTPTARPFDWIDYSALEHLHARAKTDKQRQELGSIMNWLTKGDPLAQRVSERADRKWLLFHARDITPDPKARLTAETRRELLESDFVGQKGFVVLRAGKGDGAQAVLFRYGPSLNHSNFDDLNFSYYANGYDLTYDLGYLLGSSHAYVGLSKQTASHNLVVVDEASQGTKSSATGGSLLLFADLPSVKVAEASSENSYKGRGVSLYRRTLALVSDCDTSHSYLVDIFRVKGGRQHDYFFHALGTNVAWTGIEPGEATTGSLAGKEIAWGDKILIDGDISGQPNKPYWVAPPGNGYGFMMEPREARGAAQSGSWSADWQIADSSTRLRMSVPADKDTKVVTTWAPGLLPTLPKARYVTMRRRAGDTADVFAAVYEPHQGKPWIGKVEFLEVEGNQTSVPAVALSISLPDGQKDIIYSSDDDQERRAGGFSLAGRFVHLQHVGASGAVAVKSVVGGNAGAAAAEKKYAALPLTWKGSITEVTPEGVLTTKTKLPADKSLEGQTIIFSNPAYSRTTAYRIARVEPLGEGSRIRLSEPCTLGRGTVDELTSSALKTAFTHDYACSVYGRRDSTFFQGKRIRTSKGASARIQRIDYNKPMVLQLDSTAGFKTGDTFTYDDLQPGDQFEILKGQSMDMRVEAKK